LCAYRRAGWTGITLANVSVQGFDRARRASLLRAVAASFQAFVVLLIGHLAAWLAPIFGHLLTPFQCPVEFFLTVIRAAPAFLLREHSA